MSRIVLTCGVFDLFHAGHAAYLNRCASFGDLVVAVMTDRWTEEFKKRSPIFNQYERAEIVSSIKGVRDVMFMDTIDPTDAMVRSRCNIFVHGNDWLREGEDLNVRLPVTARAHMLLHDVELVLVPYTDGVSSGAVREKILAREKNFAREKNSATCDARALDRTGPSPPLSDYGGVERKSAPGSGSENE